jgi:hypothetical protein
MLGSVQLMDETYNFIKNKKARHVLPRTDRINSERLFEPGFRTFATTSKNKQYGTVIEWTVIVFSSRSSLHSPSDD